MEKNITINGKIFKPGESGEANLNTYRLPTRTIIEIPVYVFRSKKEGPTLFFTAGMHGDETNGIEIIRNMLRSKCLSKLNCGSVIAIPIINIVSFLNGSRDLPDGRDLNRCFPGSRSGSLGSRIAYDLMHEIIPQIDFGVDFHTGGAKINNYPQVRCVFADTKNLEIAKLFAAPFTINSPYREKTLRNEAEKKGKSILVYEAGESSRFNSLAITEGINGCLRMLSHLKMVDIEIPQNKTIIINESTWVRAKISGLFRTTKKYGYHIEKDEVIGKICDPYGEIEEELIAHADGYIIGLNNHPVINEGDALIHIGIV